MSYYNVPPDFERVVPDECPECGGTEITEVWDEGNAVCKSCGLVVCEGLMDTSSEWRTFAHDEGRGDPSRVSGPDNPLLDSENYTGIGAGPSGAGSSLHRTARQSLSSKDRAMIRISGEIDTFLANANCSSRSLADHAKEVFKQYHDAKSQEVSQVRVTKVIVAICIFIAFRSMETPRTWREVCGITGVPANRIRSGVLEVERLVPHLKPTQITFIDGDNIVRFMDKIDLKHPSYANNAERLANHLYADALSNRTLTTVYATSIYIIAFLVWTDVQSGSSATALMEKVAMATGAAVRTIRQAYREAYPVLEGNLPEEHGYRSFRSLPMPLH